MSSHRATRGAGAERKGKGLRLLLVTQYFHPEVGATQTRMREFAKNLARFGHQVTVVCEFPNHPHGVIPEKYRGKWFASERLDGFDVMRVWVKTSTKKNFRTRLFFYFSFMFMSILGGLKIRGRFDAVIATSPPLFVGVSGWVLCVLKRAKFVFDIRDIWPEAAVALGKLSNPKIIGLAKIVEGFLYRRAWRIIAVTRGFVDHIKPSCNGSDKIHFIPNGTVTEIFNPNRVDTALKKRLGLEGKFVICFAGNMGIAQGLPFLLDLAKNLGDHKDIHFLLIGAGPVRDQLMEKQKREGIDNVLIHDQVPLDDIAKYLTMSDVLLVPLRNDPVFDIFIPSKIFDFLSCKKPIILGVNGEARALLEKRGGGLYARAEDLESYRQVVLTLRDNPAMRERMANQGHAWVTADYTRESQAKELERILLACREN